MSSMTGADLCARFEAALPSLLDLSGEEDPLDTAVRAELLAHEQACPRCARLRKSYAATVDLLRALPRRHAPPGFLDWVGRGIDGEGSSRLARRGRAWWLSGAAAAVLALGATLALLVVRPAPVEVARVEDLSLDAVLLERGELKPDLATGLDVQSPPPGKPSPPAAAAAAESEPMPPLIAIHVPVQARWREELQGLETELRVRFEAPHKKEAVPSDLKRGAARPPAADSRRDAAARPAEELSPRARSQTEAGEARERANALTAGETAVPLAEQPATTEKLAVAGEFTLAVDRRELLSLVASLNEWASRRGGQLDTAQFDLEGWSAGAAGKDRLEDAQGPSATGTAPAEGVFAEEDRVEQQPLAQAPASEERIQVRIRIGPTPARRE